MMLHHVIPFTSLENFLLMLFQVMAMNEFAERLCGDGHYEAMEIQQRRRDVLQRRSKVKDLASERRSKLEDCRKLMVFLQNCSEVSSLSAAMHIRYHTNKYCMINNSNNTDILQERGK